MKGSKSAIGPLASALASVQVDFNAMEQGRPDTVQNDGISGRERKGNRDSGDLADILIGTLDCKTCVKYFFSLNYCQCK